MTFGQTLTKIAALLALSAGGLIAVPSAHAAAWTEAGDAQLRSEVTLLANAGLLASLTMQWPLLWTGIADALSDEADLALFWQIRFCGRGEVLIAVRASHRWRSREQIDDRLPDGWHAWLRWWSGDTFFSVPQR